MWKLWMRGQDEKGLTLMEVIVILGVVAILATILAPMVIKYLEDASKAKAESDVRQIAAAILKFNKDTGRFPFYTDGTASGSSPAFKLLKGPGTAPTDGGGWSLGSATSDTLDAHLQRNSPTGGTAYSTSGRFKWKGPYLDTLTEDAWGNTYLVNVEKLKPGDNKQAWVISAGPNLTIDTTYDAATTAAPALGSDDIGARIQ